MVRRLASFAVLQCLALSVGWWLAGNGDELALMVAAALLTAYVWLAIDAIRAVRLLRWLQGGATTDVALGSGVWGELSDRVRRLARSGDRSAAQSESRLQDFLAALQASPNGVTLLDDQGRIEWFNQTASSHFGFDGQRDLWQHVGNLVRDPGFVAYLAGRDYLHELTMPGRADSVSRPVRLSVQLHPYGEGRSLLLSRDITVLEQADAMRRDFVANVSHEIRTPLTVLAGFVETLQTLTLDEVEQERYLDLMAQQAERMQTLVNDLLTLSRLEGSPPPSLQEWISVKSLIQQCAQDGHSLSMALWQQSHDLQFEMDHDCEIAGSAAELHSALFNLVGNAIRYTPVAQRILVQWRTEVSGAGEFSVHDSGVGIAPEHLPRLTQRFYRVDRSRSRETGGTGLGLAIVKHVAQRHGAELVIESTLGKGSTFTIHFPVERVRRV